MCGIIGVTAPAGVRPILPVLLDGLARLEYRGYDSSGVALVGAGSLYRQRRKGKLAELAAAVGDAPSPGEITCGIGHNRWATHGRPSDANAHPHLDCTGRLALIHNGIFENHVEIGDDLVRAGHVLTSETDSEVLAHLIEDELAANGATDLAAAVRTALRRVEGSFGVCVVHADFPDLIVAARRGSPLIVAHDAETQVGYVASDIPALLAYTRDFLVVGDDLVVEIRPTGVTITDFYGERAEATALHVDYDLAAAEKGGYPDFMLKEIHEQPQAVRETLRDRLAPNGRIHLDEMRLSDDELRSVDKVFIVGCGTSYHAAMVAKYAIEKWTRLPVETDIASEFRYRDPVLDAHTLVVGVSQSGESIDTLFALKEARSSTNKAMVLAITNVVDSSMARDADAVLYTRAGPEICVASTKCHLAQIVAMEVLALYLAQLRGTLYPSEAAHLMDELSRLPDAVAWGLTDERVAHVTAVAERFQDVRDFFYLGRGASFPVALEGALKLKELSYLRAEGYPGGELKHGPIALIEEGTVVVGVASRSRHHAKLLGNIQEVKARGATIILVAEEDDAEAVKLADAILPVPSVHELFSPAVDVVPLQLFAYALAKARGNDVDQPRNLAKTVTVE